jgi:Oxysterol-binding protein.
VTPEIRQSRLKRFTVPIEEQGEFESVKLWQKVTQAIEADNQNAATDEKAVLEEAQRTGARERKAAGVEWVPKYFALVRLLAPLILNLKGLCWFVIE